MSNEFSNNIERIDSTSSISNNQLKNNQLTPKKKSKNSNNIDGHNQVNKRNKILDQKRFGCGYPNCTSLFGNKNSNRQKHYKPKYCPLNKGIYIKSIFIWYKNYLY